MPSFGKILVALTSLASIPIAWTTVNGPVVSAALPEPAILATSGSTHVFTPNSSTTIDVKFATSPDGGMTWELQSEFDALLNVGNWASANNTWTPDVIDRGDGTFMIYYAAWSASQEAHCMAAATSTSPFGPYTPESKLIACQTADGGTIDTAGSQDVNNTRYIVYNLADDGDGNGSGIGPCGESLYSSSYIMLQEMEADGVTPTSDPVQILDRGEYDGPLIEAPALIFYNETYVLTYCSG